MELLAARRCAFGNGTRQAEFVFGTYEVAKGSTPYEFEKELIQPRPFSELENGTATPADGVSEREFATAFRNGHLTMRIEVEAKQEAPAGPIDYKLVKISDTDLSTSIKTAISNAGINTLGDLETFGENNDGFKAIDGIADASEAAIFETFEKFIKPTTTPVDTENENA